MNPLLYFKSRKLSILFQIVVSKLFRAKLPEFNRISCFFKNKQGIEIGGPSNFFTDNGYMPLYSLADSIDGCNFSTKTAWEGTIIEGRTYNYTKCKKGNQFICEGAEVETIPKGTYDFVLSCNNLEHIANPLKAVSNWIKLLKKEGSLVLVLPKKESNFDNRRSTTSFEHLLQDYQNNVSEDDLTHIDEILTLHDLKLDPLAGSLNDFKIRAMRNVSNRCLHHHVFDTALLEEICKFFNLKTIISRSLIIDHIIVAQKLESAS